MMSSGLARRSSLAPRRVPAGVAATLVMLAMSVPAQAACPGPSAPFGGGAFGFLTCDGVVARCERKAADRVAAMAHGLIKCHLKTARRLFKGRPFDEEGCEDTVLEKYHANMDTTDCPCVATALIGNVSEALIDSRNHLVFCDSSGTPFDGDDTGFAPTDKQALRCQSRLATCGAKLVKDFIKCHRKAEKRFLGNRPFDSVACKRGPLQGGSAIERFDRCVAEARAAGGCLGCEDTDGVLALSAAELDASNGQIFCMSPSGAFLALD